MQIAMLPQIAQLFGVSTDELLGTRGTDKSGKRDPTPKLQQQMERLHHLPKAKQKVVMDMLDGCSARAAADRQEPPERLPLPSIDPFFFGSQPHERTR